MYEVTIYSSEVDGNILKCCERLDSVSLEVIAVLVEFNGKTLFTFDSDEHGLKHTRAGDSYEGFLQALYHRRFFKNG